MGVFCFYLMLFLTVKQPFSVKQACKAHNINCCQFSLRLDSHSSDNRTTLPLNKTKPSLDT